MFFFFIVIVDEIVVFFRAILAVIWEIIENTYYFNIWHYIDDIQEWENVKKTKQTYTKQKTFK